jgi:hypothetical protein
MIATSGHSRARHELVDFSLGRDAAGRIGGELTIRSRVRGVIRLQRFLGREGETVLSRIGTGTGARR